MQKPKRTRNEVMALACRVGGLLEIIQSAIDEHTSSCPNLDRETKRSVAMTLVRLHRWTLLSKLDMGLVQLPDFNSEDDANISID